MDIDIGIDIIYISYISYIRYIVYIYIYISINSSESS